MKRLSLQWRITIMTALLTCAACVLTNCLVGYTGMRYMDAIGSDISAINAAGVDSPQAFDPTKAALDDEVTIVVNDAQESFGATARCITIGVTLLGGVLAYFVSGRALKPLRDFAAQVERVQPDNLSEIRLSEDMPTELQRCSASFNDMIARLGEGFSAQRQFTGNAAHELRTPLTAISGWAETLSADPGANIDQTKRGLGIILKESRRLTTMVEELLEFTKMQDGRFTLRVESVDLASELEDAIYTYRELFRQEGIDVSYNGPDEEVPPIVADSERMKQVFCNVLDNAAKHGGSGKKIDVSAAQEDGKFVIRVRDYGAGIPEEELPFVKQKFYKGSSRARGSGIGLAVCEEIVTMHGGTLTLENAEAANLYR